MTEAINIRDNVQARRRLIGASALLVVAIAVFPIVMDQNPSPPLQDIEVKFAKNESKNISLKSKNDSEVKNSKWRWPWQSEDNKTAKRGGIKSPDDKSVNLANPANTTIASSNAAKINSKTKDELLTPSLQVVEPTVNQVQAELTENSAVKPRKSENAKEPPPTVQSKKPEINKDYKGEARANANKKTNSDSKSTNPNKVAAKTTNKASSLPAEPVTSFDKQRADKNKSSNANTEKSKNTDTNDNLSDGVIKRGNVYFVYTKVTNKTAIALEWKNKLAAKGVISSSEPIAGKDGSVNSRLKSGPYSNLEAAKNAASKIRSLGL